MKRSLRAVLSRVDQLAQRVRAGCSVVDAVAILQRGRNEVAARHQLHAQRGYGETAAERFARHLERNPGIAPHDAPAKQALFWHRRHELWTRLESEFRAEATREAAGFPPGDDPAWWSLSDQELWDTAWRDVTPADGTVPVLVAQELIEIRAARAARAGRTD